MAKRAPFEIEVQHEGLKKYRLIRGHHRREVQAKAEAQEAAWEEQWQKKRAADAKKTAREEQAERHRAEKWTARKRTEDARKIIESLAETLTIGVADAGPLIWENHRPNEPFPKKPPLEPRIEKPDPSSERYRPRSGLLDWLRPKVRREKEQEAEALLKSDLERWGNIVGRFETAFASWKEEESSFLAEQEIKRQEFDELRSQYLSGEPEAVREHASLVLRQSQYPGFIPKEWDLLFVAETGILLVEYQLPSPENLPKLKQVKYSQTVGKPQEIFLKPDEINKLYDSLAYQVCLRTIHELFVADEIGALKAITFNGQVRYTDRAVGKNTESCIVSIQVPREDFDELDLTEVNPAQCFRKLKGIGTPKLHSLSAVPPLMRITKDDERFVEDLDIVDRLEEGTNIASISPEEFEHLIGELFRKEFAAEGEVRVTRTSRDGGVDAVIFDPDFIRGGKILIQAKRYTSTVDVAAVRELYGVVINEGASKGILVTTSTFGHDAYTFVKDKPITLMDRNNLLYMLKKHKVSGHIDLESAKQANRKNVIPIRKA